MAGYDRDKALDTALSQIERAHGKGAIMRLGDEPRAPIDGIPTGALSLDIALGGGGFPRGRIIEIFGPESSGKTTVALHAVANAQKQGGVAAFIDAEHALDPAGPSGSASISRRCWSASRAAARRRSRSPRCWSSRTRSTSSSSTRWPPWCRRAEVEGEIGDSHVGLQARLMSQALRMLTGGVSRAKTCMIFINQIRQKIGVMFGSPETTAGRPGARSSTARAARRPPDRAGQGRRGGQSARAIKVKVVKNKVAPPFRQAEFDLMHDHGISREGDLIDIGVEQGFVRKAGAWFTYDDIQLGQGKENARTYLIENPDTANEIEKRIKESLGIGAQVSAPAEVSVDF